MHKERNWNENTMPLPAYIITECTCIMRVVWSMSIMFKPAF